jgi:hypothetical protein
LANTIDLSQSMGDTTSDNVATTWLFMKMLNEFGVGVRIDGDTARFVLGVRTSWSNPDSVVAKLVAIPAADVVSGRARNAAQAIADAAPTSPFAGDLRAGTTGWGSMMLPMIAVLIVRDAMENPR